MYSYSPLKELKKVENIILQTPEWALKKAFIRCDTIKTVNEQRYGGFTFIYRGIIGICMYDIHIHFTSRSQVEWINLSRTEHKYYPVGDFKLKIHPIHYNNISYPLLS